MTGPNTTGGALGSGISVAAAASAAALTTVIGSASLPADVETQKGNRRYRPRNAPQLDEQLVYWDRRQGRSHNRGKLLKELEFK